MTGFPRIPIQDLVVDERTKRAFSSDEDVWSLNLDQIESDSGRILSRLMVDPKALGPSTYPFESGTVLYSKLRPYLNKVVVADADGYATTELVPLKCDEVRVLPSYLAYFLRSPEFLSFANTVVAGAKMPRMVMGEFWSYKVPLPPLPEQRRIAAILDKADALRTKRREALAQLDRLAQSIFVEMFGDQRPNSVGSDSVMLADLVDINPRISQDERQLLLNTEVSFLPMASVSDTERRVIANELRPYDEVAKGYTSFKRGDLLVAKITPCYENGKMAITSDLLTEHGFGSTEFHVFRSPTAQLGLFTFYLLCQDWIAEVGAKSMKGAAGQKRVPAEFFGSLRVKPPQTDLLEEFAAKISKIEGMKKSARLLLLGSDDLFASLQHRAFRGEL